MSETSILQTAYETYNPSAIIACFSGGYDSMVATHIVEDRFPDVVVASIDTGLTADGWPDYIQSVADRFNWNLKFWHGDLDGWSQRTKEYGFAFNADQHKSNFYYLKQKAIRQMVQDYKQHNHDRIMLISGVRRAESPRRASAPEIERKGCGVYVNPLVNWSDEDIIRYRLEHGLPDNPFYEVFKNSGDCLCNWGQHIPLEVLQEHAPKCHAHIKPVHDSTMNTHGYGYNQSPSQSWILEKAGQLPLFDLPDDTPNLCDGCTLKAAPSRNDVNAAVFLDRMEW